MAGFVRVEREDRVALGQFNYEKFNLRVYVPLWWKNSSNIDHKNGYVLRFESEGCAFTVFGVECPVDLRHLPEAERLQLATDFFREEMLPAAMKGDRPFLERPVIFIHAPGRWSVYDGTSDGKSARFHLFTHVEPELWLCWGYLHTDPDDWAAGGRLFELVSNLIQRIR